MPWPLQASDYQIASLRDHGDSPEELLLAAEETPRETLTAEAILALPRDELAVLIELLPLVEQDILIGRLEGRHQREIAAVLGISQSAVSEREHRAIRRLRWFSGPGSWFTPDDIRRDAVRFVRCGLKFDAVVMFSVVWETGNMTEAGRRIHRAMATVHGQLHRFHARLRPHTDLALYRRGLDEFFEWGIGLATEQSRNRFVRARRERDDAAMRAIR